MRGFVIVCMLAAAFVIGGQMGFWHLPGRSPAITLTQELSFEGVVDENAIAESRLRIAGGGSGPFLRPLVSRDQVAWDGYFFRLRGECDGWKNVVEYVEYHFTHLTAENSKAAEMADEEGTIGDSLLYMAMKDPKRFGVSPLCVVLIYDAWDPEQGQYVLLTTGSCDLIFSYEDDATTPVSCLSKLDRRLEGYSYDTLQIGAIHYENYEMASAKWSAVGIAPFVSVPADKVSIEWVTSVGQLPELPAVVDRTPSERPDTVRTGSIN